MPLMVCPDCGKEHSDAAKACPNCGRPHAPEPAGANKPTGNYVGPAKAQGSDGCFKYGCLGLFVLIVVGSMISQYSSPSSSSIRGESSPPVLSSPKDPAQQLALAKSAREAGSADARIYAARLAAREDSIPEVIEARALLASWRSEDSLAAIAAERRVAKALAPLRKTVDKMTGATVWKDRSAPRYVNSRTWVGMYLIQTKQGSVFPRLAIYYVADDWLFIQRYHIKVDDQDFVLTPDAFGDDAVEQDNDSGIWEWWDVAAEGERMRMLRTLSIAKSATIRFTGRQYRKDRTISANERLAVRRTLEAYDALEAE